MCSSELRYMKAQEILFGQDLDLSTRFNVKSESEKGIILLEKVFSVYQALMSASARSFYTHGLMNDNVCDDSC